MTTQLLQGNCIDILPTLIEKSVHCIITSPPYYGLRDYGVDDQIGLEETPEEYAAKLVQVFTECWRVLRDDGTLWLNLGDSYAANRGYQVADTNIVGDARSAGNRPMKAKDYGLKPKDLIGIPWRVAFALQSAGWYLRSDIIWHKPNPMPESVTDRPTKSHEYIFLLTKSQRYYYDAEAIKEQATGYDGRKDTMMKGSDKYNSGVVPGQQPHTMAARGHERWQENEEGEKIRNKRSVWTVPTSPYKGAHFATFPTDLIKPMVLAGCPVDGTVLDPFNGSGTTGEVAISLGRNYIGIELNPEYLKLAEKRLAQPGMKLV